MTPKQIAQDKIQAAQQACHAAEQQWKDAANALAGSINTNGYGVHHDQYQLRDKLLDAQASCAKALAHLATINWPTEADYDTAD